MDGGREDQGARNIRLDIVPQFCDSAIGNLASTAEASPLHRWNGFLKLGTVRTHGRGGRDAVMDGNLVLARTTQHHTSEFR